MLQLVIGLGLIAVLGALVYIGLRERDELSPLEKKLADFGDQAIEVDSLEEVEMSVPFVQRVVVPAVERLANTVGRLAPEAQIESTRRLLERAGLNWSPTTFLLGRIIFTIVLGVGGLILSTSIIQNSSSTQVLIYTVVGIALGYMLPDMYVRSKASRRQREVVKYLPDALDLLVICVEAGLGLDAAMGRVYEKWDNEISLAFGRVLREIQLGTMRRDALRNMADRMDVPDMNSFIAAVIQAEQLGVSMRTILRVQADQMRVKRRQRAQEKAQQAPVKMVFPMVLLIFPSIWIVLLGPAALKVIGAENAPF